MAQAKQGDTVKVHYTGKLQDGTVFDSSVDKEPLTCTIGDGQVISGFEQAIVGMNPGDSKTTEVSADDAYGQHLDDLVMEVGRDELPEDIDPEVGQRLVGMQGDGKKIVFTVTEMSDKSVTLDANHPLAGQDLTFDLELLEIV
ncbi:peptidylprolyl isomerase [candidate division KSB1 bacterium]|nr:peptidylprolyl isomerase [candidate division KSB1 bacterium]NIR73240.1 peptidylprolyl isomerase [candidate division KSB1 bacterium]NIS28354.1 peptidylprolyl isomerase [candidate division KSB1 bacterium]NIT74998.1 peptidylprolyl isomerase [candidate division KSB1 bacterium]NIU29087.1 peptidylprolyl isomerase [candidate division KSB1 bacterium]